MFDSSFSGDDSELVVPANHSQLYVWGNPLAAHQLLWKVQGVTEQEAWTIVEASVCGY